MPDKNDKTTTMRWVLFWVFIILFVIIVVLTLLSVFFNVGNPTESQKDLLFKVFIIEIGLAVVALFYAMFNLKQAAASKSRKVRLDFGDLIDIQQFIAKTAVCSLILDNGEAAPDIKRTILDDNGPYISLDFPKNAQNTLVSVQTDSKLFSGSFPTDSYRVTMT